MKVAALIFAATPWLFAAVAVLAFGWDAITTSALAWMAMSPLFTVAALVLAYENGRLAGRAAIAKATQPATSEHKE